MGSGSAASRPRRAEAMASRPAPGVRAKARVIGALIAAGGLAVLHRSADGFLESSALLTSYRLGVLAIFLAGSLGLVGLTGYDMGRPGWAMPRLQLGGVVIVLAVLPLLLAAFLGVRGETELVPALFFTGLAAFLGIILLVFVGQTKAESDRARRLR